MISLVKIVYLHDYTLELHFSNETFGVFDFSYLLEKQSVLTQSLRDVNYFKSCFIDFGALCWKNSLELSAESLYEKMQSQNLLQRKSEVA